MKVNAYDYLKKTAETVLRTCSFEKETDYFGEKQKRVLLLPSGDEKYGSFWLRDCAMMAGSGLIPDDRLREYVLLFAAHGQNGGTERKLKNGLIVPPYALCDHLNYDGRPVFYPGTMSSGDDQGDGTFGILPPIDDNYYFILMAAQYVRQSGDKAILDTVCGDLTLRDRLLSAFEGIRPDPETGLCCSDPVRRAVDWGFCDTVRKSGLLLMPSLLRANAAMALNDLIGNGTGHTRFPAIRQQIVESLAEMLYDPESGWFLSASGRCRQHDVWGTVYAVYSGLVRKDLLPGTLDAIRRAYLDGTAVRNGAVRHILSNENRSLDSAWEDTTGVALDDYQNGAYWPTATGWYFHVLYLADKAAAFALLTDHIRYTIEHASEGAPFEFFHPVTGRFSGRRYGTSAALPFAALEKLKKEGLIITDPEIEY